MGKSSYYLGTTRMFFRMGAAAFLEELQVHAYHGYAYHGYTHHGYTYHGYTYHGQAPASESRERVTCHACACTLHRKCAGLRRSAATDLGRSTRRFTCAECLAE